MLLRGFVISIFVVTIAGRMYGADDFLPMLTYVTAQCDMPQLDAEIEYMMELLDPSLLNGEGTFVFHLTIILLQASFQVWFKLALLFH